MNIFVLDEDPVMAAQYHMNEHLRRQIMTTSEILCNAHVHLDGWRVARISIPAMMRIQHLMAMPAIAVVNQPWFEWAMESHHNYYWLRQHLSALIGEIAARVGARDAHAALAEELAKLPYEIPRTHASRTPWPRSEYSHNTVQAYRQHYARDRRGTWLPGRPPEWYTALQGEKHGV